MQSPRHLGASPKGLILFSFIRFTSARYGPIRALEANSAWGADKICRRPLGDPQGDIGALRDALHELMWKASASSATDRDCAAPRPRSLLAGGSPLVPGTVLAWRFQLLFAVVDRRLCASWPDLFHGCPV